MFLSRICRQAAAKPFFKVTVSGNVKVTAKQSAIPNSGQGKVVTRKFRQHLSEYLRNLADPAIEKELRPLRHDAREAADAVLRLKSEKAAKDTLDKAVDELKERKRRLEEKELELAPVEASFDRTKLDTLLHACHFYRPAFGIYGAFPGLLYLGSNGSKMMANLIGLWEDHFVFEEQMLQITAPHITPQCVLRASGHVDRFADWMVRDVENGEYFRADHFVRDALGKAKIDDETKSALLGRVGNMGRDELWETIQKYSLKSPAGNGVSPPEQANQMFAVQSGFSGETSFLRPETAQGIFVEFNDFLHANKGKMPFAIAQTGTSFRNEVNPKHGLIRTREFQMCEIEHFHDPLDTSHPRFAEVRDSLLNLYTDEAQQIGAAPQLIRLGDAVAKGHISSETIGYYLARTNDYLQKIGIDPQRLRFRQHQRNEMAHYAKECWDAEVFTSYGWIECAGIADRGTYDLGQHSEATNVPLKAERRDPITGTTTSYTPAVIEPSFGMGRIMYALLEHSFRQRAGDELRMFLCLHPEVAPIKCAVLPLASNSEELAKATTTVCRSLHRARIPYTLDDSNGSIGKRYARTDRPGTPFAITVDYETLQRPQTVTVRLALSQQQARVKLDALPAVIRGLIDGSLSLEKAGKILD
ncbi:unnamed protein product, partial [Mesorhabditis spiculigera]